jgi:hypothetical protein
MRNFSLAIALISFFNLVASCKNNSPALSIKTTNIVISDAVSSGSAMLYHNDSLVLFGDDAEYYAKIALSNQGYVRKSVFEKAGYDRIAKLIKHDIESACIGNINGQPFALGFSSGGISPNRDTLFAIPLIDSAIPFKVSLLAIYNAIRNQVGLSVPELNIEGATMLGDQLILLNRGNNFAVVLSWSSFSAYILRPGETEIPSFKIVKFALPIINKFPVGISGACEINDSEILFTASLEETIDFIQDGAVKGSYIGILKFSSSGEIELTALEPLKDAYGNVLADKLESITIMKKDGDTLDVVAVADNDDGKSKLFYMTLTRH